MTKLLPILLFALVVWLAFVIAPPAHAMPEYATRVGEPCATCHTSPAGGGLRNLRGQAWVASDKPGVVPSTAQALETLGLSLPTDMSAYEVAPATIPPPAPLVIEGPVGIHSQLSSPLLERLLEYDGN